VDVPTSTKPIAKNPKDGKNNGETPRFKGRTMKNLPGFLKALHWLIVINLVIQVLYGAYMVFFVVTGEGSGPLWGQALDMPFEKMVTRRLYALETWVAIVGLSLYLGLTEILPRLLKTNSPPSENS
tara:strand:- start:673 stop:1050 length:378 start_codon:yes stop_codon:yes gene_type:complete